MRSVSCDSPHGSGAGTERSRVSVPGLSSLTLHPPLYPMHLRPTIPLIALLPAFFACSTGAESGALRHERVGSMGSSGAERDLRLAMADSASWPSYGRDQSNQRYSPLRQIGPDNVGRLRLAWSYHTGIPHAFEASPVVVGGTMFVSTPLNHVIALNAAT